MSSPNIPLFKQTYFPPEIAGEITSNLPIADMYPGVNLAKEIERRSYIPDDVLVYDMQTYTRNSQNLTCEIHVKAGELITKIVLRGDKDIIASTDDTDISEYKVEFISNKDYILSSKSRLKLFYKGIDGYDIFKRYTKNNFPRWLMKNVTVDSNIYFSKKELDPLIPAFDSISQEYDSIEYPDRLKLHLEVKNWLRPARSDKDITIVDGKNLNACFSLLYQLATVNRYWRPETFHLLNKAPRSFPNFILLPKQ
jgi:hypothetical protein